MQTDRFRDVVTAEGPFVSVYFDDSHDTEDAAKQAELTWRAIADDLRQAGAPDALVETVHERVVSEDLPVGRSGRVIVAHTKGDSGEVLIDEHLSRPPDRSEARFSDLPYLVPIVEQGETEGKYLVVAVDHQGADVDTFDPHGDKLGTETVSPGGHPVHKASSADDAGYGDPNRRVNEKTTRNIEDIAAHLTTAFDGGGIEQIFVIGVVPARPELVAALPQRVQDVLVELEVGSRADGAGSEHVESAIEEARERRKLIAMDDAAQNYRQRAGTGLATEGLADVTAALRDGKVESLIIGDLGDVTVLVGDAPNLVATDADALSRYGSDTSSPKRADEALVAAAVATGGDLVRVDERLDPADGIAALLRY